MIRTRSLAALACLFALLLAPVAQAQTATSLTVLDFGIYSSDPGEMLAPTPTGIGRQVSTNIRNELPTRTVIAGIGVEFGFHFLASSGRDSDNGKDVPVRLVTRFPAPGVIGEGGQPNITYDSYLGTTRLGEKDYFGWEFAHPTDLIPGKWTLEIWSGDKKLTEQSFEVVLPGTS